jgi:hypothetical protein
MATEKSSNPQPDDLPESERTGNEPNPSGKSPKNKTPPGRGGDEAREGGERPVPQRDK